jgi:hypothetical protein
MSIRVGFDVDGVVANFNKTFRETAAQVEGGDNQRQVAKLNADAMKRVWDHIARTPQWWLRVEPFEPEVIRRLYELSRDRRWEVYFMTTRPSSAGETTQFQTQWWLESNGFPMPSVLTVPGSRGDAANALKLDIVVDDRLTNCVDVIAASRAKVVLLLRHAEQQIRDQALARGIGVVGTLAESVEAILNFEEAKHTHGGRLSRLADWFKPSKHEDERLPRDPRANFGAVPPPRA